MTYDEATRLALLSLKRDRSTASIARTMGISPSTLTRKLRGDLPITAADVDRYLGAIGADGSDMTAQVRLAMGA
tara:strand:- start:150 stop:371 length:222 start_codon:yes stop_codon:yes gene_type:complete